MREALKANWFYIKFEFFVLNMYFLLAHDVHVFDINYNHCNNRKTFFHVFGAEEMT